MNVAIERHETRNLLLVYYIAEGIIYKRDLTSKFKGVFILTHLHGPELLDSRLVAGGPDGPITSPHQLSRVFKVLIPVLKRVAPGDLPRHGDPAAVDEIAFVVALDFRLLFFFFF